MWIMMLCDLLIWITTFKFYSFWELPLWNLDILGYMRKYLRLHNLATSTILMWWVLNKYFQAFVLNTRTLWCVSLLTKHETVHPKHVFDKYLAKDFDISLTQCSSSHDFWCAICPLANHTHNLQNEKPTTQAPQKKIISLSLILWDPQKPLLSKSPTTSFLLTRSLWCAFLQPKRD